MSLLRVFGNKVYNFNHIKTMGMYTSQVNGHYIRIEWVHNRLDRNGISANDFELVYQEDNPDSFGEMKQYIQNLKETEQVPTHPKA